MLKEKVLVKGSDATVGVFMNASNESENQLVKFMQTLQSILQLKCKMPPFSASFVFEVVCVCVFVYLCIYGLSYVCVCSCVGEAFWVCGYV